jgi:hypothetical protein
MVSTIRYLENIQNTFRKLSTPPVTTQTTAFHTVPYIFVVCSSAQHLYVVWIYGAICLQIFLLTVGIVYSRDSASYNHKLENVICYQ